MIRVAQAGDAYASKKCEEAKAVAAKAKSAVKTSEAEVKCLKEVLGKAENDLASKKKKRWVP